MTNSYSNVFEFYFGLVLLLLIIIAYWTIYSQWFSRLEQETLYNFKRGKTEYSEPPRPHSRTFNEFLKLVQMSTPVQQSKLTQKFAQLIKEHFEPQKPAGKITCSENLANLLNDPKQWLQEQYKDISFSSLRTKKKPVEILAERYIQIFEEVQELTGVKLLPQAE